MQFDCITPENRFLKMSSFVYKSLHCLALKYISDMLDSYEPPIGVRSSGTGLLLVPRVRSKHSEAAFEFHAATIWNSHSDDTRKASTPG